MRVRPSGATLLAVALAVVLATGACGTRRSDQELAAAAGASSDRQAATAQGADLGATAGDGDAALADEAVGATTGDGVAVADGAAGASQAARTASGTAGASTAGVASGSSGSASGASGASPSAGVAAGPAVASTATKSEIVIGSVGTLSGLVGTALKPGVDGLRVWVQWINSKGGLNGHPVRLVVADDQSDPARHRSLVQQLVEQHGVVAFVQNAEALSGLGSVSYHQSKRVPVIGSEGSNQYWNENSMYFPQMSHGANFVLGTFAGQAQWAKDHGYTKIAKIVCTEAASCKASKEASARHAKSFGVEIVYEAEASIAKPDYTAECLNARNAGAQAVSVGMDPNAISRIAAACARQGWFPAYLVPSASYSPQHLTDSNMREVAVDSPVAPFGSAATQEMADAFKRYLPSASVTVSHVEGWVAGKVLERAARNLAAPTSAAILEGLWTIKGEDINGLSGPQTFNKDKPVTPSTCWFNLEVKGGKLVPYNGGKRTCTDIKP